MNGIESMHDQIEFRTENGKCRFLLVYHSWGGSADAIGTFYAVCVIVDSFTKFPNHFPRLLNHRFSI